MFSEGDNLLKNEIEDILKKLIEEKLINEYKIEENEFENKNWNEEWEKNLNIIKVTDKIVIKPSFKEYIRKENEIVLTIDPKMSFGTGEHQTTKLMLSLIEKYVKPGMKVLDVGSGTAVLAIASVKLGAEKAIAIDNDEICFENGIENCKQNNVGKKVEVKIGQLNDIEEDDFDLILANIQKNVILEIADDINKRLKRNGFVILSGLLVDDENDVDKKYTGTNFSFIEKKIMDEWMGLVFNCKEAVSEVLL